MAASMDTSCHLCKPKSDGLSQGDIFQPYSGGLCGHNLSMAVQKKPRKKPKTPEDPAARAYYEEFRDRLRVARDRAGLSQPELADLLDIPLSSYKQIEGKRLTRFPLHKLAKLAYALHASLEFIVTGRETRGRAADEGRRAA